jgi:hypothetical protein
MWHGLEAQSKAHYFLPLATAASVFSQVLPHGRAFGPVLVGFALRRQATAVDLRGPVQYQ